MFSSILRNRIGISSRHRWSQSCSGYTCRFFSCWVQCFFWRFCWRRCFFVISGFLITKIIMNELEEGRFSLAGFYERRARRILPALFVVTAFSFALAWVWMLPNQMKDFSQSLVAVSLFVSNILFWREDNYFSPDAEEKPLLHTWSLAVEEQYYLLFPVFMILFWRLG